MKSIWTVAAAVLIAGSVSGCVPVIGVVTLNDLITGTSLAMTALTGKSLTDQALSVATGKDCSVMDAVLEKDRHVCEVAGSQATEGDFKGLIAMSKSSPTEPQPAVMKVAASPGTVHVTGDVPLGEITAHVPVREIPAVPSASADPQPGDGGT